MEVPSKIDENDQSYLNVVEKFYGFNQTSIILSKFYPIDYSNWTKYKNGLENFRLKHEKQF